MKLYLFRLSLALLLAAVLFFGATALAEEVPAEGLTEATEVVEEVGEVDLYAPEANVDAGETAEQPLTEHNAQYYYDIDGTFPDAVFRKYVKQNFDWDEDGYLSDEECESVTTVFVINMGIRSLDGISIFENLEELYCSENKIDQLDVSYNESLVNLDCAYNQITSLWLPQSSSLERLDCYDNKLTWLDLTQNVFLHSLWIQHNNIESIDIGDCNDLINVMDEEKGFLEDDSIIWQGNDVFFCVDKDIYIYSSNDLLYAPLVVEIDDEHFPADDFRDYVSRECDSNDDDWLDANEIDNVYDITLRSWEDVEKGINVMYCPNLKGIEYFTNLTVLECRGCSIKTMNLNKNTSLVCLYCDDNRITKLDARNLTSLEMISCQNNKIKNLYLGKNKELETLYADGNKLKKIDIKDCTKLLKRLKQKKGYDDTTVYWYRSKKDGNYADVIIDKKTKVTAGSKVLYAGK